MTLTPKHIQVRDYYMDYFAKHQEEPSLKEIASACGLSNLMSAWRYKDRLKKAGELKFTVEAPKAKAMEA